MKLVKYDNNLLINFYNINGLESDDSDLIEECKNCEYYNLTCFPKVLVYR